MTVVQINSSYGAGNSTGRNTMELHAWLLENQQSSYVFTNSYCGSTETLQNVKIFGNNFEKKAHAFFSRISGLQGYFSSGATQKLINRLTQIKPDVVMLGVLHSNCLNFPMLMRYLAEKDVPTVLVLHDCWYFTGHCCHYTESECDKWKTNCKECPKIHEWNPSWLFDTAEKCLNDKKRWYSSISRLGVIGVSDWITNEAKQSILKNSTMVQRIYNWIDTDIFKEYDTSELRSSLKIKSGQKVIVAVCSKWSDRKGLATIINLAKQNPKYAFVLVGNEPDATIKDCPANIIFVGPIMNSLKLAHYYSMGDVYLNPSVQETFGKTTAEALACGTPVLVYDTTACPELVGEKCGRVVPLGDEDAMNRALNKIIAVGKEEYCIFCKQFANENYNKERNIKQYYTFLKTMCEENV